MLKKTTKVQSSNCHFIEHHLYDVFVHDMQTHTTSRVSVDAVGNQVNGDSARPRISEDGRYVTFESTAPNLLAGEDTNNLNVFHVLNTSPAMHAP